MRFPLNLKTRLCLPLALSLLLPLSPWASLEGKKEAAVKRVLLYDFNIKNRYQASRANLREALARTAEAKGFSLTMTAEQSAITYSNLKTFDVVIFAHGEGDVLPSSQGQKDFERYVREGGGFVAIHSAAGRIHHFPFLKQALFTHYTSSGAGPVSARLYADSKALQAPALQEIFSGLPKEVVLKERWFNFKENPRKNPEVTVLFSVDESTYQYGRMKGDHPIVWTQTMGKGRVVYNALGYENVYTQQNGFGAALLWNLMTYAANKGSGEPLAKATSLAAPAGVTLTGNSVGLSLGEGSHVLRISDFQGKVVLSKTFVGPGQFHVDPALAKGRYTLTLAGPDQRYQKPFTVR